MSSNPTNTNIYYDWLQKARSLTTEQTLYIPCENRAAQKTFSRNLKKELDILNQVDPIEASTLSLGAVFKDSRHWVCIRRVAADPYSGFIKSPDGSISRVRIEKSNDRLRRLALMVEDGWTRAQIEESESTALTDFEIQSLWPDALSQQSLT